MTGSDSLRHLDEVDMVWMCVGRDVVVALRRCVGVVGLVLVRLKGKGGKRQEGRGRRARSRAGQGF